MIVKQFERKWDDDICIRKMGEGFIITSYFEGTRIEVLYNDDYFNSVDSAEKWIREEFADDDVKECPIEF